MGNQKSAACTYRFSLQQIFSKNAESCIYYCTSNNFYIYYLYGILGNNLYKKKWIFELVSLKISAGWMYIALPIVAILMMIRFFQAYKENYDNKKVILHPGIFLAALVIIVGLIIYDPKVFRVLRLANYYKFGAIAGYVTIGVWLVMIFMGVPVGWSLMAATIFYFSITKWNVIYFASAKLVDSLNSFNL